MTLPNRISDAIRSFWDEKAREDPYWYVSSSCPYGTPRDIAAFWASGERIWGDIKAAVRYNPEPTHTVIEIGCGVGRITRAIAQDVGHVDASDVSSEMLHIARRADIPNVTFRATEGFSLAPLPNKCADFVLAYCVFQHLPSSTALRTYLGEMVRVAKPGAIVAFTLTPRDWQFYCMPLLRIRAYLRECFGRTGPKGLYRREWVGIRPSRITVHRASSISLRCVVLHNDKWLFFGERQVPVARSLQASFKGALRKQ